MLIQEAKEYAIRCHRATNHYYGTKPYSAHLYSVAEIAHRFFELIPEDYYYRVIAACWAHDVIEDTRQTYNDVKKELGENVADIVYALTNEKGKNRMERANDKYYSGIRNTPYATFVKLCDRIANIEHSIKHNSSMLSVYKKENEHFKEQLFNDAYLPMFDHIDILLLKEKAL